MAGRRRRTFRYVTRTSQDQMPSGDRQMAEEFVAELVARAYAADHPDLFKKAPTSVSGSSPAARADAVAPAAKGDDSEDIWSLEHEHKAGAWNASG